MTKVILNADWTVKLGNKTYKVFDAINHAVIVYDEFQLLQLKQLDYYKQIGDLLIQLRAFYPSDKLFGQAVAKTELGKIKDQDRWDAKWVAEHWTTVQKLNKSNKLDSLGISSIRKKVTEKLRAEGKMKPKASAEPKVQEAASNKPKASTEPKVQEKLAAGPLTTPKVQNEVDLAKLVADIVKDNGLDFSTFVAELTKIRKAISKGA